MHGLGNDFVLLDHLDRVREISPALARFLADRRRGVGCDQVVQLLPSPTAQAEMRIFNPDGSRAEMCGNAVRCVARYLRTHRHLTGDTLTLETLAGPIRAWFVGPDQVAVDMGMPTVTHSGRPLELAGAIQPFTGVSMGNPHAVFFTPDVAAVTLETFGPAVEHHSLFPNRTNVELVQVIDRETLRMRVWERGAGITPACGTGACAAAVAAAHEGHAQRRLTLLLDGGALAIHWREDGRVIMTGAATEVFIGTVFPDNQMDASDPG